MEGTGRYSLARGVVGTVQGIGGSCSQAAAGFLVSQMGYPAAFLASALIAAAGLVLVVFLLPETTPATLRKTEQRAASRGAGRAAQ